MADDVAPGVAVLRDTCNVYVLRAGREGVLVDFGAGTALDRLDELGVDRVTDVLLTHHHYDHVCEVPALRDRWPGIEVLTSARERDLLSAAEDSQTGDAARIATIEAGEPLTFGVLEVHPLHTPGHTGGMLSFLVGRPARARGAGQRVGASPGKTVWRFNPRSSVESPVPPPMATRR